MSDDTTSDYNVAWTDAAGRPVIRGPNYTTPTTSNMFFDTSQEFLSRKLLKTSSIIRSFGQESLSGYFAEFKLADDVVAKRVHLGSEILFTMKAIDESDRVRRIVVFSTSPETSRSPIFLENSMPLNMVYYFDNAVYVELGHFLRVCSSTLLGAYAAFCFEVESENLDIQNLYDSGLFSLINFETASLLKKLNVLSNYYKISPKKELVFYPLVENFENALLNRGMSFDRKSALLVIESLIDDDMVGLKEIYQEKISNLLPVAAKIIPETTKDSLLIAEKIYRTTIGSVYG